ncbi:MAG TPA: cadherin domain-containing protein, partial [Candidatus Obscuribacterales bacterium]
SGGEDQGLFTIDATTGELSFLSAPDFEQPLDVGNDNGYAVEVTVTDADGLSTAQLFNINVTNVNEAPTIVTNSVVNAPENTTLVVDIQATDDSSSEGDGLSYSLSGGADQTLFAIDAITGELSFLSAPDFEQPLDVGNDNGYAVEVTVTDAGGLSTAQLFNITVTNINEAPTISSAGTVAVPDETTAVIDIQATDDTNSEGDGLTYSLSGGADQSFFSIDPDTGNLAFLSAPDFETPLDADIDNTYDVDVSVTDADGASTSQQLSISVTDVNEDPTFVPGSGVVNVPENTTLVVDIEATDDSNSEGNGLTYSLSDGADQSLFTIDAATGELSFLSAPDFETPLDVGNDNGYAVEVTLTDAGGLSTTQLFNITVTDVNDPTPFDDILSGTVGDDTILALEGNDVVRGLDGDDRLFGQAGNDRLLGGVGDDVLNGGADSDRLFGQVGNDTLIGGTGNDVLNGGADNDRLFGQVGNDTLIGGTGNNLLNGGADNDRLFGQAGSDRLDGGTGNDRLDGGTGNDVITTGAGRDLIVLRQNDGFDRVTDFQNDRDRIDLVGIRFGQLSIVQQRDDVLIRVGTTNLVRLEDTNAVAINQADFV